eukprot:UN00213
MYNIANVLFVNAIKIAGLAFAFPVGIGFALVLGTVLTYIIDPEGNPYFLFGGVLCAFVAIMSMSVGSVKMEVIRDSYYSITP